MAPHWRCRLCAWYRLCCWTKLAENFYLIKLMRFFVGRGQSNLCVNKSHEGLVKQRASLRTVAALASISTCESKKQVLFLKLIRTDPKCHLHCSRWPNFWGFWDSFSAAASTSTSSRSPAASCSNGASCGSSRSSSSFSPSPSRFSLDTYFSRRWSKVYFRKRWLF